MPIRKHLKKLKTKLDCSFKLPISYQSRDSRSNFKYSYCNIFSHSESTGISCFLCRLCRYSLMAFSLSFSRASRVACDRCLLLIVFPTSLCFGSCTASCFCCLDNTVCSLGCTQNNNRNLTLFMFVTRGQTLKRTPAFPHCLPLNLHNHIISVGVSITSADIFI